MNTEKIRTAVGVLAIALASSGVARGETSADIGTLPSQKVPAPVEKGDRNPFATSLSPNQNDFGSFDADTEESKIRQIFANLKVNGRAPSAGGPARVLVGDLILTEGADIPQLIENQTNVLRVTRITDKEVEITWIDEEEAEAPRKLLIPVNLKPEVSFLLPGRSLQGAGQFVTQGKPEGPKKKKARDDEDDEEELDDESDDEGAATPEQPKRVSPFGLFRR